MSNGKFAPVTAFLVARKGEAAPSPMTDRMGGALLHAVPEPGPAAGPGPATGGRRNGSAPRTNGAAKAGTAAPRKKIRRLVLTLTPEEYERLGIAAVKSNLTRKQLALAALFAEVDVLARAYGKACKCLTADAECVCAPSD